MSLITAPPGPRAADPTPVRAARRAAAPVPALAYVVSVLSSVAAIGVTRALGGFLTQNVFVFLLMAVLVSGLFGGLWPGLLAMVVGGFGLVSILNGPGGGLALATGADLARLGLYLALGVLISSLCESLRRARRAAARREAVLRSRDCVLESVGRSAERVLRSPGDSGIGDLLSHLGASMALSRVYVFENLGEGDDLRVSQRHEWAAPGVEPQIGNPALQDASYRELGFMRWARILGEGGIVHGAVRDFPAAERQLLEPQGIRSLAVVPIEVRGAWWGFVGFDDCDAPREWSQAELDALRVAAALAGALIERKRADEAARDLEREHTARQAAELAERRFRFLAEAGEVLSASLDYEETLQSLARLCTKSLADYCFIDLCEEDGRLRRVAVSHRDPKKAHLARELMRFPLEPERFALVRDAYEKGRPLLLPSIPPRLLESLAHGPEHLRLLRTLELRSVIGIPLSSRGQVIGVLTLASCSADRVYGEDDLALAVELARRAALALDNAQLYVKAQEASRAKSNFISVMSHELATPLSSMILYAEMLEKEATAVLSARQLERLCWIRTSGWHLHRLIEQILAFSRLEAERVRVEPREADAAAVAREALALLRPIAEEKGLRFELLAADAAVPCVTDADKLRQILLNVVGNAVKFTDEGEVVVELVREDGTLCFRVRDTGPGIAPVDQERVFEPFVQADQSAARAKPGTGIGLAVSRRLARLLGGSLTVRSAPGAGSVFSLCLPAHVEAHAEGD